MTSDNQMAELRAWLNAELKQARKNVNDVHSSGLEHGTYYKHNRARLNTLLKTIEKMDEIQGIEPDPKLGPFGCLCQTLHHHLAGDGCEICQGEKE